MKKVRADDDSQENVIQPPNSLTIFDPPKQPVLYAPDGTALTRRPAGFHTELKVKK